MEVLKPLHKIFKELRLFCCFYKKFMKSTDVISWIEMFRSVFGGSLPFCLLLRLSRKAITILPFKILIHCETPYSVIGSIYISAVITLQIIVYIPLINVSFITISRRFPFMLMRFLFVPSLALISSYRFRLFTSIICACS